MATHPHCNLIHVLVRVGWDMTVSSKMFEYLLSLIQTISEAGRALAAWNVLNQGEYPPWITFDMSAKEKNFAWSLFECARSQLRQGDLQHLHWTLFASLMMYFTDVQDSCGSNHLIILKIMEKAKEYSTSEEKIQEFSEKIKEDWIKINI